MQEQQQQLVDRLKQAQNILVTVSNNPSVDQLAACIGLTLVLNHLGKHATAVFSGKVPSTLEFLRPNETLETTTDSLRDFIIALDKSKADKLRYKVEDQVVRIFITPYRTSITDKDLDFSQGDFNVDVVVGLGVREQQDLDSAITAHGRILHDATVASINTQADGNLGSINWIDTSASSLSELVVNLADALDKKVVDSQIATALLTGIVANTERFSNDKTTPKTMSASAVLMAAGANPQLIATQLDTPIEPPAVSDPVPTDKPEEGQATPSETVEAPEKKPEPGTLEITHEHAEETPEPESNPEPTMAPPPEPTPKPQVQVDDNGQLITEGEPHFPDISKVRGVSSSGDVTESQPEEVQAEPSRERMTEEPARGGQLTANNLPEALDPTTEELTLPPMETPMLNHDSAPFVPAPTVNLPTPQPPTPPEITNDETLRQIEEAVHSPHLQFGDEPADTSSQPETANVDDARDAVQAAFQGGDNPLAPVQALHAQTMFDNAADLVTPKESTPIEQPLSPTNAGFSESTPGSSPADQTLDMPLPQGGFGMASVNPFAQQNTGGSSFVTPQTPGVNPIQPPSSFPGNPQQQGSPSTDPHAPPPVPPPMLPPLQ